MSKSIKATIWVAILAVGIGAGDAVTCGGFTNLNGDLMTNCQYDTLRTEIFIRYPTGKEVIHIDDWPLLVAVINKEIQKQEGSKITITNSNQTNTLEKIMNSMKTK